MADSDPNLDQPVPTKQQEEETSAFLPNQQVNHSEEDSDYLDASRLPALKLLLTSEDSDQMHKAVECIQKLKSTKLEMTSNSDYREVFELLVQAIENPACS